MQAFAAQERSRRQQTVADERACREAAYKDIVDFEGFEYRQQAYAGEPYFYAVAFECTDIPFDCYGLLACIECEVFYFQLRRTVGEMCRFYMPYLVAEIDCSGIEFYFGGKFFFIVAAKECGEIYCAVKGDASLYFQSRRVFILLSALPISPATAIVPFWVGISAVR